MKCKFCGYDNPDSAMVCSRCGTPLQEGQRPSSAPHQVSNPDKKTVLLNKKSPEVQENVSVGNDGQMIHECGYPLLPGTQVCPNCHKPVTMPVQAEVTHNDDSKRTMRMPAGNAPAAPQVDKSTRRDMEVRNTPEPPVDKQTVKDVLQRQTVKDVQSHQQVDSTARPQDSKKTVVFSRPQEQKEVPVDKKTVYSSIGRPQPQPEPQPEPEPEVFYCSLKPMTRTNEPEEALIKKEYETGTGTVVLNRDNTEPGNFSITSREQAVLTCENGEWFIEDHSSLQTTFVRVARKTPIKDGDIVLMGDREFVFSTKKER